MTFNKDAYKVHLGVNKDNVNDFGRKYNMALDAIEDEFINGGGGGGQCAAGHFVHPCNGISPFGCA